MDSDIASGWLAFPFGFAAAAAIFASCTDAMQSVNRIHRAANVARSGWGIRSLLFASDAIFVESDVWGDLCREGNRLENHMGILVGNDTLSKNSDGAELVGKWASPWSRNRRVN